MADLSAQVQAFPRKRCPCDCRDGCDLAVRRCRRHERAFSYHAALDNYANPSLPLLS